ncbi:MAG: hypothetical protein WA208_19435 [Thermoanaerobaculia bacterium]
MPGPSRRIAILLLALAAPLFAQSADLPQLLQRFERLAAAKDFAAAEVVARDAASRFPASRDAKLALSNALLWRAKYAEAQRSFRELLVRNANDREARLGLANALYWSGDLRGAAREYGLVREHPEAARALGEIRAAAAPLMRLDTMVRSDAQPLRSSMVEAGGSVFSDPLTRWDGTVGTWRFDTELPADDASFARLGVETSFPHARLAFRANATLMRFPDGETHPLGLIAADRRIGRSTLSLTASRSALFGSATALDTHAYADSLELKWSRPNASARVESLRFFDDNRGLAADAWLLVPAGPLSVGGSLAFRDTFESRFVTTGVYDPYWTPIDLREARLIATGSRRFEHATAAIHADVGVADEDLNGRYYPWRASLSLDVDLGRSTIRVEAGRQSTVFYTANEFRATLARGF